MLKFYIVEFCRFYILTVLSLGVYGKLRSFTDFRHGVEEILNLSQGAAQSRIAKSISGTVIITEAVTALLTLAGGNFSTIGIGGATLLVIFFTVVIARIIFQKRLIHCNCFGVSVHAITWLDLVRNMIILSACSVFLVITYRHQEYLTIQTSMLNNSILFCLAIILSNYTMNLKELQFLMRRPSIG
ncbi:MAG: hypothetical protein GXP04_10160 [Alphaproteobacteria bacterium]|nr:hypothetical protein [Alphaproteobacteria bacterium]